MRTGETYTYDTPHHVGNSPSNGTIDGWVDFISALMRQARLSSSRGRLAQVEEDLSRGRLELGTSSA